MVYNYSKLRGRIVEVFGTIGAFSEAIGISRVQISTYLNNKTKFNQATIETWCRHLNIPIEDAVPYFFTPEV